MQQWIDQIERDGYCHLQQVYSPEQVAEALRLVNVWYERTKDTLSENKPNLARNDKFVWNLQNKDHYFIELLFAVPLVQQILLHFLNDPWFKQIPPTEPNYIIRALAARSSNKRLPMHIDSLVPYTGDHVFVMQVAIILEDQSVENGCTVVVPGSHKSGAYVDQSAFDIAVPIESKAGDIVIWDSRIWHGALPNHTHRTRWSIISTYIRWWIKQMFRVSEQMPQEIYERLTAQQKAVLGFCSIPHLDETYGIDMKRTYEELLPNVEGYRA